MKRAFISYRREDSADVAGRIFDHLERAFGREALFMDVDSIPAGVDFRRRIAETLDRSCVLLLIIGDAWLDARHRDGPKAGARRLEDPDDYLAQELRGALKRGIPVIPVLVGRATMPTPQDLPATLQDLAYRHATQVRAGTDFSPHIARLVGMVREHLGVTEDRPSRKAVRARTDLSFAALAEDVGTLVGTRLGAFTIGRPIAEGGGGLAYQATNPRTGQLVCVKVSLPVLSNPEAIRRAVSRGIRGLVTLNHPHIVRVHEFDDLELADGSSFYVVMDYVDGERFDTWSRATLRTPEGARNWLRTVWWIARALDAAHRCRYADDAGFETVGVMHGDVKPGNILVRADGSPTLIDFMLVDVQRAIDPRIRERMEKGDSMTAVFGTPGFMAPEQQEEGVVTVRSDVYGLGATLLAVTERESVPNPITDLIRRMTAPRPAGRPEDMRVVADEVARIAAAAGLASPEMRKPGILRRLFGGRRPTR